jgi:predicted DNA-binding transcriptional regulator YafY
MSRHLERLLQIDELLRSGVRQTQGRLAESLEVSERTIRDDIAFLRDRFGAPLEFDRSLGWRYTDSDWRLPSISLSQGELFALILGARMLEAYGGSAYESELRSSIKRLSERLPAQTWIDLQQLADERILFRPGAQTLVAPQIWNDLLEASRRSQRVLMRYYTASRHQESERIFDPYLLHVYRGTNPYTIGFCHQRQAIRWFRVDRIRSLQILPDNFVRDPNFDPKQHLDQIFQCEVGGKPVAVAIWFDALTAPYIRERRWHSTQQIEEQADGSLTLRMEVTGLNELKRWVLGYGKGAKVIEPQELMTMVKEELARMCHHYDLLRVERASLDWEY